MKSISLIAYAILIINLVSCSKEFNSENLHEKNTQHSENEEISVQEYLFPDQIPEEFTLKIDGREVILQKFGDQYLLGGDVVLSQKDVEGIQAENMLKGAGVKSSSRKWPNSVAYFELDFLLTSGQIANIRKAVDEINNKTNFTFIERIDEPDYITISKSMTNSAFSIGKKPGGGTQPVFITENASVGTIQHELMHSIGIFHEHSRMDRNSFVKIHWGNIKHSHKHNFNKYKGYEGKDIGNFDFKSLMIYPSHAFSKNGLSTITKKNGSLISKTTSLSNGDINTINKMYPASHFYLEIKENGNRLRPISSAVNSQLKQQPQTAGSGSWLRWKKKCTGDGYFHLVNKATNKLFRPKNANSSSSLQQKLLSSTGSWCRWKFVTHQDGYIEIINKQTTGKLYAKEPNHTADSKISCGDNDTENLRLWRVKPVN